MDGWNTIVSFWESTVRFREGQFAFQISCTYWCFFLFLVASDDLKKSGDFSCSTNFRIFRAKDVTLMYESYLEVQDT